MSKTTEIINHLDGADEETITKVGSSGQVQLIKSETDKDDMHEFYDTEEEANTASAEWLEE